MTPSHAKGARAESAVIKCLQDKGWTYAERRALQGAKDRGDIAGIPGVVFEVKAGTRLEIPAWLAETDVEKRNDSARVGVLVVKPRGIGDTRVDDWWAIQRFGQFCELAQLAGF